jgi:hypothetical protein
MKYQAVKSFNAHENGLEGRADVRSLSEALSYIQNTPEGHIWAHKEIVVDERVGAAVASIGSREVEGMTEDQVLIELERNLPNQKL